MKNLQNPAKIKNKLKTIKLNLHVKHGDLVQVISGREKGKKGKVRSLSREKSQAIVVGVNLKTRHVKPQQKGQEGIKIECEFPIATSNLIKVEN